MTDPYCNISGCNRLCGENVGQEFVSEMLALHFKMQAEGGV